MADFEAAPWREKDQEQHIDTSITVSVETLAGQSVMLRVPSSSRVSSILEALEECWSVRPSEIQLTHRGVQLNDTVHLCKCGIEHGSVVQLSMRLQAAGAKCAKGTKQLREMCKTQARKDREWAEKYLAAEKIMNAEKKVQREQKERLKTIGGLERGESVLMSKHEKAKPWENLDFGRMLTIQAPGEMRAESTDGGWATKIGGGAAAKRKEYKAKKAAAEAEAEAKKAEPAASKGKKKSTKAKGKAKGKAKKGKSVYGDEGGEVVPLPIVDADDIKGFQKLETVGDTLDHIPDVELSKKKMTVMGAGGDDVNRQDGWEEKATDTGLKSCGFGVQTKMDGVGYVCKKGHKPFLCPNQDDFALFITDNVSIVAVFDGHGKDGHKAAHVIHKMLPAHVVRHPRFRNDPEQALKDAFPASNLALLKVAEEEEFDREYSGTTATVALIKNGTIYMAHVGDSRAVLGCGPEDYLDDLEQEDEATGLLKAEDLTRDHWPRDPEERARIEAAGGEVRTMEDVEGENFSGRVFVKGMTYPALSITRALGDSASSDLGISCSPDVSCRKIDPAHRFLIVASDGVWSYMSSQEAVDVVSEFPADQADDAAEALAAEAWNRWVDDAENMVDDITVLVYHFKREFERGERPGD